MKLPKKVNILGYIYTVRQHNIDDKEQDGNVLGYVDFHNLRITVSNAIDEQQQFSSLVHEIIEAINHHCQLELEHNKIKTLETGFYQVLKDNGFLKEN